MKTNKKKPTNKQVRKMHPPIDDKGKRVITIAEKNDRWDQLILHSYKEVKKFNEAMKVRIAEIPQESVAYTRILYGNLIREELAEYINATNAKEKLDGLVDLLYVANGAMLACGLAVNYIGLANPTLINRGLTHLGPAAVGELCKDSPCWERLSKNVPALCYSVVVKGTKDFKNFEKAFDRVHAANMSKLWRIAPTDRELRVEKAGGESSHLFIVRRRSDGKIMKPPGFVHPDLSDLV